MSSFSNPHYMYLFEMTNGKKKLAYGQSPEDALSILRLRLTDEEMAVIIKDKGGHGVVVIGSKITVKETGGGKPGILQVTEYVSDHPGLKVRYKFLDKAPETPSTPRKRWLSSIRKFMTWS